LLRHNAQPHYNLSRSTATIISNAYTVAQDSNNNQV